MFIIVSEKPNDKLYINKKIIFLESACLIKFINDDYNLLFILSDNIELKEDGFFIDKLNKESKINDLSIDEIIISLNIKYIFLKNKDDNSILKVKEVSSFYNIPYAIIK